MVKQPKSVYYTEIYVHLTCSVTLPLLKGQDGAGRSQEGEGAGLEQGQAAGRKKRL